MLRLTRERRDPYEVRSLRTRVPGTNPGLARKVNSSWEGCKKVQFAKERKKISQKKVDLNHRVLSVKVRLEGVAPAREHSDHHQVLRRRTIFFATYPGRLRQLDNNRHSIREASWRPGFRRWPQGDLRVRGLKKHNFFQLWSFCIKKYWKVLKSLMPLTIGLRHRHWIIAHTLHLKHCLC